MARKISKEFRLAAACCSWPPSSERNSLITRTAAGVDWHVFLKLAERHRIQGLVWHSLRSANTEIPEDVSSILAKAAAEIARQNLTNAAETMRLQVALGNAGAKPLFLKGISLSILAYRSLSLKMGWDIDVLVASDQLEAAVKVLKVAGYSRTIPGTQIDDAQLRTWHRHWKESVWRHAASGTYVELHTALVDNPLLLRGVDVSSPHQYVDASAGISIKTLAADELFAYLCVHGASSGWFRLKWLADISALLAGNDCDENERLYRRSQELGAGRAAGQALLLAASLFEVDISSSFQRELRSDATTRLLVRTALRKMDGRGATRELHESFLGTASIHAMQLGLLPGLKFKLAELARQMVDLMDRLAPHLPKISLPIYHWLLQKRPLRRFD